MGNDYIMGAVGALQFEVTMARLEPCSAECGWDTVEPGPRLFELPSQP